MDWNPISKRFVLFAEIINFEELIKNDSITEFIKSYKNLIANLDHLKSQESLKSLTRLDKGIRVDQTVSFIFSRFLIVFTKSDSKVDLIKIITDGHFLTLKSLNDKILLKSAISFGEIYVDPKAKVYFGMPIVTASNLCKISRILLPIFDNSSEYYLNTYFEKLPNNSVIQKKKIRLKTGEYTHSIINMHRMKHNMFLNMLKDQLPQYNNSLSEIINNTINVI